MLAVYRRGAVSICSISKKAPRLFAPAIWPSVLSLAARNTAKPAIVSRYLNSSSTPGYNGHSYATRQRYDEAEEHLETGTPTDNGTIYTKFQDLADSGLVNPAVIREITHGMGHATMTQVQSMTINEALRGRDT